MEIDGSNPASSTLNYCGLAATPCCSRGKLPASAGSWKPGGVERREVDSRNLILKYFIQSHAVYTHKAEKDWTEAIMLI
jgi:hypothetical protein